MCIANPRYLDQHCFEGRGRGEGFKVNSCIDWKKLTFSLYVFKFGCIFPNFSLNFQTLFFKKLCFAWSWVCIPCNWSCTFTPFYIAVLHQPRPQAPVRAWGLRRAATFLPFPAHARFSRAGDVAGTAWYSCKFCFVKYFYLVSPVCYL